MNIRLYILIVLFGGLFCIVGMAECLAQTEGEKQISVVELKEIIMSEDTNEIVRAMNRVKQNQGSHDLMVFAMDLWEKNTRKYAYLPWRIINSDIVRIEVANVLIQASNNGLIKVDQDELRKYARLVVSGSDQLAVASAISTLGLIKNSEDIKLIERVALEENPRTFARAIIALAENCDPAAEIVLNDVSKRVGRDESKRFLREISPSLKSYRYGCEKSIRNR
jgi:hypothetical protein